MSAAAQPAADVPAGTHVRVRLLQMMSSETSQPGEEVRLDIFEDVVAHGVVVISRGTPVWGSIMRARAYNNSATWWGSPSRGRLTFAISQTTSVNGAVVRLNGPFVRVNESGRTPLMRWHHTGETFDAIVVARAGSSVD
jgi:hypothetical protein